jgi:hypothetical protein
LVLLNQSKKYISNEFLTQENTEIHFFNPLLIAIYGALTVSLGDNYNKEGLLIPLFERFLQNELGFSKDSMFRILREFKINFEYFDFANALSKVPLLMNSQNTIDCDSQTYIPVIPIRRMLN